MAKRGRTASAQGAGDSSMEAIFLNSFHELCVSRREWEVWSDLMTVFACSISNSIDREKERFDSREKEYASCIKRLQDEEKAALLFAFLVQALESNPAQDFLGSLSIYETKVRRSLERTILYSLSYQ